MKCFTLSLLVFLFSSAVQAAPTVNIFPNQPSYQVGDAVILAVSLSDAPRIHGGGISLHFNPNVLRAMSVVIDKTWGFATRPGVINNTEGSVNDILFSSFNAVEGDLDVALIQLVVTGSGDAGFTVTESAKNPFSDEQGQLVSFGINNAFAYNTQAPEPPAEETPEQVATQTTTETTTTSPAADDSATQTTEQTATQSSTETTSTTTRSTSTDASTTAGNTSGNSGFTSNIASVNLPGNNTDNKLQTDDNGKDRQFYLPSGSGKGIPVTVTDDDESDAAAEDRERAIKSAVSALSQYKQDDINKESSDEPMAVESEDGPDDAAQVSDDSNDVTNEGSPNYLTYILVFAAVFVVVIIIKVFF
ncbi:MAG TPA: hypothetical protein ENJ87_12605 [Gammaproteobacteria bacterium]|nr:hypothetical protein [Gammaproteobacteria bacterium]